MVTQPLKIDITFYCHACGGMATGNICYEREDGSSATEAERLEISAGVATGKIPVSTCAQGPETKLQVSGTRLREMFANHEAVPEEFSRPEVVAVLQEYYDSLDD